MKTSVLAVLMFLVLCAGYAQTNFTMVATGQFDGRSSICVVGDTMYVVHNTCTQNQSTGQILLRYKSRSGTGNWVTKTIAPTISGLTRPTISKGNGFMLISYVNGYQRYMARSHNSWETWQTYNLGKTFETSPLIVPDGDDWVSYALDVPYPEGEQHNYLAGQNSEYMLMPQYFTDQELSWWDGKIQFFGQDILNGVMRSNSDIWIQRAGGGPNNGWPIFNEMVITSGQIMSSSGAYSLGGVFRGGLIQNAPTIALPSLNTAEATIVGPTGYSPNYIVYVTVDGNTYHTMLGTITQRVENVPYYSTYPATNLGNPLGINTYTTSDTVWTNLGSAPCGTGHYNSPNQLWISGVFSDHQTWSSGDKIMLKGDIFLSGTVPGSDPALNAEDSVTLITMKDVEVKYGYTDPLTSERIHLARNFFDPIYIYANIIALGSPTDPRSGKFTFEYQRPHPSVPAVMYEGSLWDKIDLHRRPYPQTTTSPWPPLVDYPWYNPLWPERQPYLERGNLSVKGSLIQRRRGFIHRSYLDADYPYNGIWNLDLEQYGGTCDPAAYYQDPVLGIPMFPDDF
ncbi:MAG: hypothetical protein U1B83_00140, partial [Candidatus Cloacimonadaceae bacterium]|nr:hypothetical protein [Candidatus Cloacimonadaceae bacterium]